MLNIIIPHILVKLLIFKQIIVKLKELIILHAFNQNHINANLFQMNVKLIQISLKSVVRLIRMFQPQYVNRFQIYLANTIPILILVSHYNLLTHVQVKAYQDTVALILQLMDVNGMELNVQLLYLIIISINAIVQHCEIVWHALQLLI